MSFWFDFCFGFVYDYFIVVVVGNGLDLVGWFRFGVLLLKMIRLDGWIVYGVEIVYDVCLVGLFGCELDVKGWLVYYLCR